MEVKYHWQSPVTTVVRVFGFGDKTIIAESTTTLEWKIPVADIDRNWFKSRKEAFAWLKEMKKKYADLIPDGDCIILTEMFFV
jgi:hypothetical protein